MVHAKHTPRSRSRWSVLLHASRPGVDWGPRQAYSARLLAQDHSPALPPPPPSPTHSRWSVLLHTSRPGVDWGPRQAYSARPLALECTPARFTPRRGLGSAPSTHRAPARAGPQSCASTAPSHPLALDHSPALPPPPPSPTHSRWSVLLHTSRPGVDWGPRQAHSARLLAQDHSPALLPPPRDLFSTPTSSSRRP